jgi:membrane protein YdbS with pleckstrin-like domain
VETDDSADIPPRNGDAKVSRAPHGSALSGGQGDLRMDPSSPSATEGLPCEALAEQGGGAGTTSDTMTAIHPDYVWVLRLRGAVAALFPILGASILERSLPPRVDIPAGLIAGIVLLLALIAIFLLPRRRWRAWGYREEEDELHVRHGLLVRFRTVVPFGRVQHIDVAQGPIERRFGLATLILHTAGTRGAAVPLPGLPHDEAERMRDRIRAKIRQELA